MAPSESSAPAFAVAGIAIVAYIAMKDAPSAPTNLNVTADTFESGNPATAKFPKQSGHLYGLPRLHFSGDWRAVTASLNNIDTDYVVSNDATLSTDEVNNLMNTNLSQGMAWSKWGSNVFAITAAITKTVPPNGQPSDTISPPFRDAVVGGPTGRIVDLDVLQQQSTLYGLVVKIGNDGFGNPLLQGTYEPSAFSFPEFGVLKTKPATSRASNPTYGGAWQSVLTNVSFQVGACDGSATSMNDPTLCGLKKAAEANDNMLAIRITVDRFGTDSATSRFNVGSVQGVIGPYTIGEPRQMSRAHQLYSSILTVPVHVSVMTTPDASKLHWVIDLGTSLQYDYTPEGITLSPACSVDMELQANAEGNESVFDTIFSISSQTLVADSFRKTSCSLIEFYTDNDELHIGYATRRLRIVPTSRRNDSWASFCQVQDESKWNVALCASKTEYFALEAPTGTYALFETTTIRMYEGETSDVDVFVTKFGLPLTNEPVDVTLNFNAGYEYPNMDHPTAKEVAGSTFTSFPRRFRITAPKSILVTCNDVHSFIQSNFQNSPAYPYHMSDALIKQLHTSAKQNCLPSCPLSGGSQSVLPRCFLGLESFVWIPTIETNATPIIDGAHTWQGGLIVWNKNESRWPEAPTWTDDILPLFRPYARLYPVMNDFVILDNYASVTSPKMLSGLRRAFSADFTDAHYMPITRDMSPGTTEMIKRWLQFPAHSTVVSTHTQGGLPKDWSRDQLLKQLDEVLKVEHATIPLYLVALYSIRPGHLPNARKLLKSIVHEEMQHMATVCSIILALGGKLDLANPTHVPKFPTRLPLGIVPNVTFKLQPLSAEVLDTFLEIEHSNQFVRDCRTLNTTFGCTLNPPEPGSPRAKDNTITEAYLAVREALIGLEGKAAANGTTIFNGTFNRNVAEVAARQRVTPVTDLASALLAIDYITTEGEGASVAQPFGDDMLLSHYMRFLEVLHHATIRNVTKNPEDTLGNDASSYTVNFHTNPKPVSQFDFGEHVFAAVNCDEIATKQPTCNLGKSVCTALDGRVTELYVSLLNSIEDFQTMKADTMGEAVGIMRELQININRMINPADHLFQLGQNRTELESCSFLPSFTLPPDDSTDSEVYTFQESMDRPPKKFGLLHK